jgi:hypothetical protein
MPTVTVPCKLPYFDYQLIVDTRSPGVKFEVVQKGMHNVGSGTSSITRNNNPSWREQIADQTDASTAYSRNGFAKASLGRILGNSRTLPSAPTANYLVTSLGMFRGIGPVFVDNNTNAALQDRALKKFKKKLNGTAEQAKAFAPIAESRELHRTCSSSVDLTKKFLGVLLQAKGKRSINDFRRFASDAWLTYQFGIAPMVRDVQDIGQAIARHLADYDRASRIDASATEYGMYAYDPNLISFNAPFGCRIKATGAGHYRLSYKYIGAFKTNITSANDYGVLQQLGIGLKDIPGVLWELKGLSWIADYFTTIGDVLEDVFYVPPGTLTYLLLNRSYKLHIEVNMTYEVVPSNPNHIDLVDTTSGQSRCQYFEFSRTPVGALPHASLRWRTKDEITSFGISKLLNLVSLLK